MAKFRVFNLGSINNKVQPFGRQDGQVTRMVNLYSDQIGAKRKRPGYTTFNGTADGNQVNTLFQWEKDAGTTSYLYRASGSSLYYYDVAAGTGDWTLTANGTITDGNHVGHAVLDDTLILGDGAGSTRHTTNGTSFTNTTLAPPAQYFAEEFNRIYASGVPGTTSDLFWSTTNDATNWQTSGTSDSSSVKIGGPGRVNGVFSAADRITVTKDSGIMKQWDDFTLVTVPTSQAYTSPYSRAEVEGYHIGLNRLGYFGYDGGRPELISNPIEKQIYNNEGSGVAGTTFENAPGGINRYEYLCAVGTVTDAATGHQITDAIQVFNYQLNEWYNYQFADFPTAFANYQDSNRAHQFIFGDANGQVYKISGTATSDNGTPISCLMEGFIHDKKPEVEKVWRKLTAFANPGCQAKVQVAAANTFHKDTLNWQDIGSLVSGVSENYFSLRGRFLFYRVYESSTDPGFIFYGFSGEYDEVGD